MMGLSELSQYIQSRIWGPDLDRLSPWPRAGLRILRMFWAIVGDLRSGDLNLRAMSLVYTTILSIVPLLAVSFSVLKGFGAHQALETVMMRTLLPLGENGIEIGQTIIKFVDNVKVGVLGSVGLALLFYTVISLMQKIELAFNFIWLVPQERPFAQRFSDYLAVIIIGPVMIFTSLAVSASLLSTTIVKTITAIEPFGSLIHFGGALLPFVLVVAAFTFIYVFMPNTRVRLASAFAGAVVAGLLWNLSSVLFAKFVVSSAQYTAIYSAFAALIIFMLWLYIGWLVLLAAFITDASWTLTWRLLSGQRIAEAHRLHAYQKLSRHWSSHKSVVFLLLGMHVFWLIPLAWATQKWPGDTVYFVTLAYIPLLIGMAKVGKLT